MNGEFVPEDQAKVSIYDSSLMFGDMVFEMLRTFNGEQFQLDDHIDRLYDSARWLHIPMTLTKHQMAHTIIEVQKRNCIAMRPDDEHRVLINVSRGILGIYQDVVGVKAGTNIIIADFPLRWTVRGMGHLFTTGINAVIPAQRSIPADLLEPKVKSRSRMHLMMANIQASQMKGEDNWALLTDPDGFITEGTGDNFFIVKNGVIYTPRPIHILRGISRQYVIDTLVPELNAHVVEKDLTPFDVLEADEAFMTGTPFCILPVTRLNGQKIGSGVIGAWFESLLRLWGSDVGVDIRMQIQEWDTQAKSNLSATTPYQFKESQ